MSEIVEHPEYNRDTNPYPSFGKRYCGEPAVISLTSWKMRIHTVAKTLYSLCTMCPGFHIVLVLSEEEFPKMMDELPENLKLFVDNELIEVLWVFRNYRSFKKVLFTMDKYRDVPVISADDDCIYTCNYAQTLYNKWKSIGKIPVAMRWNYRKEYIMCGAASLYFGFGEYTFSIIKSLSKKIIQESNDDVIIGKFLEKLKIPKSFYMKENTFLPFKFHDVIKPLTKNQHIAYYKNCWM